VALAHRAAVNDIWPLTVSQAGPDVQLAYMGYAGPQPIAGVAPELSQVLARVPAGTVLDFRCEVAPGQYLNVRHLIAVELVGPVDTLVRLEAFLPDAVFVEQQLWVPRAEHRARSGNGQGAEEDLARALAADLDGCERVRARLDLPTRLRIQTAYAAWAARRPATPQLLEGLPMALWSSAHVQQMARAAVNKGEGVEPLRAELERRGESAKLDALLHAQQQQPKDLLPGLLAHVDDQTALRAYADALLEQGHPLGEFIALARSDDPAAATRAEALRRRKQRHWLGVLADYLEDVEYRDGLPWRAALKRSPPEARLKEACAHPLLWPIERLLCRKAPHTRTGRPPAKVYLALAQAMLGRRLREIDACSAEILSGLSAEASAHVTHLHDLRLLNKPTRKALDAQKFKNVQWVELSCPPHLLRNLLAALRDDRGLFERHRPAVEIFLTSPLYASFDEVIAEYPLPVRSISRSTVAQ
jgi:uncharacterized protein (TIGR02996 family)